MKIRFAFAAVAVITLAVARSAQGRPTSADSDGRPNILVVMTDDMAASDLELMPSVQKLLAKKGTTFTNAVDSFPLCCPARATFITGQYAHNHGVRGNFAPYGWYGMKDRKNTLPAWLQDAGYRTALIGKWLNGYGALDAHGEVPKGFDIWRGLLDVSAYDYFNFVMNVDGKLKTWGDAEFAMKLVKFAIVEVDNEPDTIASIFAKLEELFGPRPYSYWGTEKPKDYSPDVTGEITEDLVRAERKEDDPFFIWWTPVAPHREDVATTLMGRPGADPRPAPRHAQRSQQYTLPQPPNFNEADVSDKSANFQEKATPLTEEQIAQLQLDYQGRIGSLLAVDDHVAKLVKILRQTDQLDNTTIVFLSDNGWMQGEHRIPGDKFLPYEESLRVPLVIRGPGVPKGQEIDGQVGNIDFAPTLVDIADATAGRTMDGISLVPTIRNPKRQPERALEIEALERLFIGDIPVNAWDRPYTGVRTDRYTYVVWTETAEAELYDRKTDPYQLDNHSGDPAYAGIEQRLAAKLRKLDDCKGAKCDVKP
jgi:arylsulfatase A-like enzyme